MRGLKIHFWGAAGCVTGSKFLLETPSDRILVDCGMFQGLKDIRQRNWEPWPVAPSGIQRVLITHGHLDHVGMLPRLVRDGFKGPICGTTPSLEVARIVLEDSAKIHEEEAGRARAEGYSRYKDPLPLYTLEVVRATVALFEPIPKDHWESAGDHLKFRFRYNGHILGACFIEIVMGERYIVFSGDIGRPGDPLLDPPDRPGRADVLFLESTYGNRNHPEIDIESILHEHVNHSICESEKCIIQSFAEERLKTVIYLM